MLDIAPETRATNCVGDLGGALEDMPKRCVTIGMKQILGSLVSVSTEHCHPVTPWLAKNRLIFRRMSASGGRPPP